MNAPAKMQIATATVTDRRVVVIAGLKAAGKSTLIEELLNGRRPDLGRLIGLHVASEWRVAHAADHLVQEAG